MDRHKYKAWDNQCKFWIEEDSVILHPDGTVSVLDYINGDTWHENGPIDIVFCTGLKDKHGKLIFEGDILQLGDGTVWDVFWHKDNSCYYVRCKNIILIAKASRCMDFEIIGNIYENPELLDK